MTDTYSKKRRSEIMGCIVSRDTRPEVRVRSVLHRMGFRFRLCRKDLPGKPDIVLPKWRVVVLVHGCFWHGHENCCEGHVPKTNGTYWAPKLERNPTAVTTSPILGRKADPPVTNRLIPPLPSCR